MSTHEVEITPEEDAFGKLLKESEEVLSEAARTLFGETYIASYALYLSYNYSFGPEDYEDAIQKMRLEASRLTDRDREYLAAMVRACEAAASSIDPNDQTPAGYRVCRGDVHRRYQMMSYMVDDVLQDV
jgi:hypothetical protein